MYLTIACSSQSNILFKDWHQNLPLNALRFNKKDLQYDSSLKPQWETKGMILDYFAVLLILMTGPKFMTRSSKVNRGLHQVFQNRY